MEYLKRVTKRQWIMIAYLPIHLLWYMILEWVNTGDDYFTVYCTFDALIPFCEWLILPYLLWFPYMITAGFYFIVKDKRALELYLLSLFIGFFCSTLTVSLFPTGQDLRPVITGNENFACRVVSWIYDFDTNTNVFPSMHVVGATAVVWAVFKSGSLKGKTWVQVCNIALYVLIICATVCLKQHSVLDIFGGLILEMPVIYLVYVNGAPSRVLDRLTHSTIDD